MNVEIANNERASNLRLKEAAWETVPTLAVKPFHRPLANTPTLFFGAWGNVSANCLFETLRAAANSPALIWPVLAATFPNRLKPYITSTNLQEIRNYEKETK